MRRCLLTPRLRESGVCLPCLMARGLPMLKGSPTPPRPREGRGLCALPDRLLPGLGEKAPPSSVGKLSWRTLARSSSVLVVILMS